MWSGKTKMIGFQHVEICQLLERREEDDMRKMELRREDAQDRVLWKNSILGNRPTRASAETRTMMIMMMMMMLLLLNIAAQLH